VGIPVGICPPGAGAYVYLHNIYIYVYFISEGLTLVKQAFETFKLATRLSDVRTLYAGELYGRMLVYEENYLMTARHWYNVFDAAESDNFARHPMTIDGLESRREIWDRLSLFERAISVARKVSGLLLIASWTSVSDICICTFDNIWQCKV